MEKKQKVIVDIREKRSDVPSLLRAAGLDVSYKALTVGDYLVSRDCIVERKTARDLISSLFDGRLMDQLLRLSSVAPLPVLIIEGPFDEEIERLRSPNAIWGALATAAFSFHVHNFRTRDQTQTAQLISVIGKHGKYEYMPGPAPRKKRLGSLREEQLNVVMSIPGIGPRLARNLLRQLGSVRAVFSAAPSQLIQVEGLGQKRAENIYKIICAAYSEEDSTGRDVG